ncbi:MAG: DUF58 domain-containing protein [Acidimicrobiales bacterium]
MAIAAAVLTVRGRWTIALGLVAGLAGRILGVPELFGLAVAALIIVMAALVWVRSANGAVTVGARAVPTVVNVSEPAFLELTIEESGDGGALSIPVVLVRDDSQVGGVEQPARIIVPRLGRGGRARASFELPTRRRGVIEAGAYQAALFDPLGLVRRPLAASRPVTCVVLPRIEHLETVLPRGTFSVDDEINHSLAERLMTGNASLRPYAPGDDLRRVHWRTTARVGELMVRDGGDIEEPDRVATTVLLEAGGDSTPPEETDRAIEVAASVLTAAADASRFGVSGDYRVVATSGLDSGAQRGYEALLETLVALAGVGAAPMPAARRFGEALDRLGRPGRDEVLVIVGAFGESPPDSSLLGELARRYRAVVLVLVAACGASPTQVGLEPTAENAYAVGGRARPSGGGVVTVPLPLERALAAAWSRGGDEPDVFYDAPARLARAARGSAR